MSATPRLPSIEKLNRAPHAAFVAALQLLFETAPPLATALEAARPFADYDALLRYAEASIAGMDAAQQIAVINAHPRIGANAAHLSALSLREQELASATAQDEQRLAQLQRDLAEMNARYEAMFGFRFVVFVNRRPRDVILDEMRARITHSRAEEMQTALHAMLAIARDRLATLRSFEF